MQNMKIASRLLSTSHRSSKIGGWRGANELIKAVAQRGVAGDTMVKNMW